MTFRNASVDLTADRLCVSPLNVRLCAEDAEDTEWLENSIFANGLIYPLVVHALEDGSFGALDGGRRFRAIRRLIDAGRLPADWPVPCVIRADLSEAEMTELSLTAALQPRDLRPWEIDAAILRAHAQGDSVAVIAAAIGQPERWVARHLRLGGLVPEIFEAYAAGTISAEQAAAFAATENQDLQRAAWTHFSGLDRWQREPQHIRAWLKIGDRELERLLRFVGADAYRAAGGRFELDLFADGPEAERGRVVDEGILRELAENALASERQQLRKATGRSDLRFVSEMPKLNGYPDHGLAFEPERKGAKIILPEGDVVALIDVTESGETRARWFWASRKARADSEKATRAAGHAIAGAEALHKQSHYAQAARQAVKDEHGLTADGLQVMRSVRRELLRAVLLADATGDGALGRDYLVWSQLRQKLDTDAGAAQTGTLGLAASWQTEDAEPQDIVAPHLAAMPAHTLWTNVVDEIRAAPFMTLADPADAFAAFHFANDRMKATAAAVLAGLALVRSANVPGWRLPVHDRIAELLGIDALTIRELWKPTPALLGLLPKLKRLELAQPFVAPDAFESWHKLGDHVLTGAVAGALQEAAHWVHPLLRFPASDDVREAAE